MVIGGGGREHAIALQLVQSSLVSHVFVCPGNAGTDTPETGISNVGKYHLVTLVLTHLRLAFVILVTKLKYCPVTLVLLGTR